MLGDYLRSFVAVLLTQFSRKRFPGGMDGVVRLAEKVEPIQARPGSFQVHVSGWPSLQSSSQQPAVMACWTASDKERSKGTTLPSIFHKSDFCMWGRGASSPEDIYGGFMSTQKLLH